MAIPSELEGMHRNFWNANHSKFNMTTNEGCGKYTEAWVVYAQDNGYPKVGHLKKSGGQTQYNGHANDAFLYNTPYSESNSLLQAVDIIGSAESTNPNDPPRMNWGVDTPRYTEDDWLSEPQGEGNENDHSVPWVAYNENSFERLKRMLEHDYSRRPQGADFDVSVWSSRYFHNCYMGPNGIPLGEDAALKKVKPELCAALGIPMDDYYG